MIRVIDWPTISSALYPKIRWAPLFQLWMMPSRFLLMMASSEFETIAASRACRTSGLDKNVPVNSAKALLALSLGNQQCAEAQIAGPDGILDLPHGDEN